MKIMQRNSFTLLYNQLWLVDEARLKQLNPKINILPWLSLSDDDGDNMREQVAILMSENTPVPVNESIVSPTTVTKRSPVAILQSKIEPLETPAMPKPLVENNTELINNWDSLVDSANGCNKCNLCHGRKNVVIERGSRSARWMFIGEAPGENEDLRGVPFVGASGELLNKMIAAMKLDPEKDVYICNVVKCRPPYNRNPEPEEINKCSNFLLSQINLVKPDIIITLGRFASQTILNTDSAVNKLRGITHKFNNIPVIVTFHPSYLLRNVAAKSDAWADLKLAIKVFNHDENKN